MARLLLIRPDEGARDVVVARRARLRERLAARLATRRLDDQLARGIAPDTRAALTLRAQALGKPETRDALAQRLMLALDSARRPPPPRAARVPIPHKQVLAAAGELEELAERLLTPGPVAARGLAQVSVMLSDGCGPLFWHRTPEALSTVAARALQQLEPGFNW
jgi:Trp operon repressor